MVDKLAPFVFLNDAIAQIPFHVWNVVLECLVRVFCGSWYKEQEKTRNSPFIGVLASKTMITMKNNKGSLSPVNKVGLNVRLSPSMIMR